MGLYSRLAVTGIRKNGSAYVPFILTSSLMTAVFYIITFLSANKMLVNMVGGGGMTLILKFGMIVMGIFSAIFLFYTNSFIVKRRKKEFGLYNILGLGKRQIARILVRETFFVYVVSIVLGLGVGILFSKLGEMFAVRMLRSNVTYSFYVDFTAIIAAVILFAVIFVIILLNSLRHLFFSRPIELLHSENTGEKPPRTNIPAAVIGFICLAVAYYMATHIKEPAMAIGLFFIAVILVIIATYLLFIAGSVVFCRTLQKNKRYYYKTKNFVSLSQMVFRMRKNGAGLASICILSTMVLVTISSTVSLYAAIPDNVNALYPHDITVTMYDDETRRTDEFVDIINESVTGWGYTPHNTSLKHSLDITLDVIHLVMDVDLMKTDNDDAFEIQADYSFVPLSEADENIKALDISLGENEVAIFEAGDKRITKNPTIKFGNLDLAYQTIDITPASVEEKDFDFTTNLDFAIIYTRDLDMIARLYKEQYDIINPYNEKAEQDAKEEAERLGSNVYGWSEHQLAYFKVEYGFDVSDDINEVNEVYEGLENPYGSYGQARLKAFDEMHSKRIWHTDTKATFVDNYYGIYGGLLFLGILLGGVFALSAALIIYYKQISEGFEDAARFEILRKVGMTRGEIRTAINSQVLKVFFLPLVTAGLHMLFAFPMIAKMLNIFNMYNVKLFALVTIISYVIFAVMYVLFYVGTSKSYTAIVFKSKK